MRFILITLLLGLLWTLRAVPLSDPAPDRRVRTVVIDPGHGGRDPGAKVGRIKEKTIALRVGLRLGRLIKAHYKGVRVVYTRDKNRFVELWQRAKTANDNDADVFISLHCNSSPSSSPNGSETYVMGQKRYEANEQVVRSVERENAVIKMEDNYETRYKSFLSKPEDRIVASMVSNVHFDRSLKLAETIEKAFADRTGRRSRGVKQAELAVLWQTGMPSVLVELGFLTNKNDRTFLNSEAGRRRMAAGLFDAFKAYKTSVEHPETERP